MKTADFDYVLPPELIAQHPARERDQSRMMVVSRQTDRVEHRQFHDLPDYLRPGELLVLNDTKVIPARIFGRKKTSGGKVELLLLEEVEPGVWDVLMRSRNRPRPGSSILLGAQNQAEALLLEDGEMGRAMVRIKTSRPWEQVLEEIGVPPLPPYISRKTPDPAQAVEDRIRYQTLFARNPGAVAAPTAGLHFTPAVFQSLEKKGIRHATVTLHVGIGTFRPVETETVEAHTMDEERFVVSKETAEAINETRAAGGRIVAVGSTSVRTLESVADENGVVRPARGRSSLFIVPPYRFKAVDAMLTNFHLPRSTLLMMVSALAGREKVLRAYEEAVREKYRFYSYGDCMLIL